MRRSALLAGHLAGVIVMGFVQSVFYLGCALLFGVEIASGVAGAIVILVLATLIAAGFGMLGALHGAPHRLRRGDPGAVPGALHLPLHVVDERATRPHGGRLVPDDRDGNPVSYLIEAVRSLIIITGWNRRHCRSASRSRSRSSSSPRSSRRTRYG